MKKRALGMLVTVLALLFLCSCGGQNGLKASYDLETYTPPNRFDGEQTDAPVFTVDNTTPYDELITTEVDIHNFVQFYLDGGGVYFVPTLEKVDTAFKIECLRQNEEGALYSVHKVKQGGLLYTFFSNRHNDAISNARMKLWCYVRNKLSRDDFNQLVPGESTIEDVIAIDDTTQIFENMYDAAPELYSSEPIDCISWHYLEDGLYYVGFVKQDGKLVFCVDGFEEGFEMDLGEAIYVQYIARILDMDWVE